MASASAIVSRSLEEDAPASREKDDDDEEDEADDDDDDEDEADDDDDDDNGSGVAEEFRHYNMKTANEIPNYVGGVVESFLASLNI
jgi:hypothetical protein